MTNAVLPPVHPGEILRDFLHDHRLSPHTFAARSGLPSALIVGLCAGEARVCVPTSAVLRFTLGTTAEYWLNLQTHYDVQAAHR